MTATPRHPMQPIVVDERGNYRFKKNAIVEFLLERGGYTMNDLAMEDFSNEDRMQFAQLIGYSVSGYGELPYASRASVRKADVAAWRLRKKLAE